MLDDLMLLKNLSDQERLMFQNEYLAVQKNGTTGFLLAFFLGGLGAHHFYMGRVGLGVLYAVFCWTLTSVDTQNRQLIDTSKPAIN
jgi:hypothetical protein